MKIEKPKCEEYVLFLASQSHTQRAVVKALSQCVNANDLQEALAGITFWPWDRGDLLCWATVLNLFDDYLLSYIVDRQLCSFSRLKSCKELLNKGVNITGTISDNLIISILDVTYSILFNSSSRSVYNSSGLLVSLLDSFNLAIVIASLRCLSLVYSGSRNKRRPIEVLSSNDLLLRLPFFCASPLGDIEKATSEKSICHDLNKSSNGFLSSNEVLSSGSSEGLSNASRYNHTSTSPSLVALSCNTFLTSFRNEKEVENDQTTHDMSFDTFNNYDKLPGEFLRLYCGQFHLDTHFLSKKFLCLENVNNKATWKVPKISYTELMENFSPADIACMSSTEIIKRQTNVYHRLVEKYFSFDFLDKHQTDECVEAIEAHFQEIRQKIRHLWWSSIEAGRRQLVDVRLVAFNVIIAVNPQFFLNYLGTCSTLLADLTFLLRHHCLVQADTLCYVIDLWTAIIQDDLQRRTATFLLGLSSPHGLFPTLVLKFLKAFIEKEETIPFCLKENKSKETSQKASNYASSNNGQSNLTSGDVAEKGSNVPLLSTSTCSATDCVSDSQNDGTVWLRGRGQLLVNTSSGFSQKCSGDKKKNAPNFVNKSHELFLNLGESPKELLELHCKILERLMELILSVKISSMFPITAVSHTTILECLLQFVHVLDASFLPVIIRICRIFETMVEVVSAVDGVMDILVSASDTFQLRLQYEVVQLASLPMIDADDTQISETPLSNFYSLASNDFKQEQYHTITAGSALQKLNDLKSNEAITILEIVQEITQRRSLVYFIFRQLDAYVHGANVDLTRRIFDLYSGPSCLASRFIFQYPYNFGLAVYGVAVTLLGDYLAEDPSIQPTLIERGVIPDFLNSVAKDVLPSEDALQAVSICLTSILLHHSGVMELQKLNYQPLSIMINVVISEEIVGFDRVGELMTIMGNGLGDAAKNQEVIQDHIIQATLQMVQSIAKIAWDLPKWIPVSTNKAEQLMEDSMLSKFITLKDLCLPDIPSNRYLSDRLANMARFLQAMLRSSKMISLFLKEKGAEYILQSATSPSLPPLFLKVLPHHPLNGLIRLLATNGIDSTRQSTEENVFPVFVHRFIEMLPNSSQLVSLLPNVSFILKNISEHHDSVTPDIFRSHVNDLNSLLKYMSELDMALYLLVAINKDASSYTMTLSSVWKRGQYLPFMKLACHTLVHLYQIFPQLVRFLYSCVQYISTETPVVLSTRHSPHEHPSVRASRKYLPPGSQPLQATKFFWSSLATYAYSVRNPVFESTSFSEDVFLNQTNVTPTLLFEIIRSICHQCRLVMSLTSRLINKGPTGRIRVYQSYHLRLEWHAAASYLALTGYEFLKCIPAVPWPMEETSGVLSIGPRSQNNSACSSTHCISVPGLNPYQTARYISEIMDLFFRLHVNERGEGCLLTLTFDTFYKGGGLSLVLKGFQYCLGLLVAMSMKSVKDSCGKTNEEMLHILNRTFPIQNPSFPSWIHCMMNEIDLLSKDSFQTTCDIASKCLHCCISYCEKITSWKRLFNSLMTDYLQKISSRSNESKPKETTTAKMNVTSDQTVVQRSQDQNHMSHEIPVLNGNTRSIGVGTSYVKLNSLFTTCSGLCGNEESFVFDASILLRSIQGMITRHMIAWMEFLCVTNELYTEDSSCYLLHESIMSLFSTKAINCMIKIFYHFMDAESPNRKKSVTLSKESATPSTQERRQPNHQVSNETESFFYDTLDQLVERQLSSTSSRLNFELSHTDKLSETLLEEPRVTDNQDNVTMLPLEKVNATTHTDSHVTLSDIFIHMKNSSHGVDWSQKEITDLLDYTKKNLVPLLLDIGKNVVNHSTVITEVLMKLVALPLPLISLSTTTEGVVVCDNSNSFQKQMSTLKQSQINGHFITHCLLNRLNNVYETIVSLNDKEKLYFFEKAYTASINKEANEASTLSVCRTSHLLSQNVKSCHNEKESSNKYRDESLMNDQLSNEEWDHVLYIQMKRLHKSLYNDMYILVNLLHRSAIVRQAFSVKEHIAVIFFLKFLKPMICYRKKLYTTNCNRFMDSSNFYTKVTHLGVDVSEDSPWFNVPIPTWCLKACKPYLQTNTLAEKAVETQLASRFKDNPSFVQCPEQLPTAIYEKTADFPKGSQPPDWFNCCFLGIEMTLVLYEFSQNELFAQKKLYDAKNKVKLISIKTQHELMDYCLDVIYFFPGLKGSLATVLFNLLLQLTSRIVNATRFLDYKPFENVTLPGGGLSVLLQLPRTAHFTGILRLTSVILFNLCENIFTFEIRFKQELAQYFLTQGQIKKFHTTPVNNIISEASPSSNVLSVSAFQKEKNSQQMSDDPKPAQKGLLEERVVPLNMLLVNLYIYLRRDFDMFKSIIMENCVLYNECKTISEQEGSYSQNENKMPSKDSTDSQQVKTNTNDMLSSNVLNENFDKSHSIYVSYKPKSSNLHDKDLIQHIQQRGSQVISTLLNYLDLYTIIQAHSRVTPSFSDILEEKAHEIKCFFGKNIKNISMYPFSFLPDSLLFFLDELLATTPQYALFFLEKGPTLKKVMDEDNTSGFLWPDETIVLNKLSGTLWKFLDCEKRPSDWTLMTWLLRNMFPKLITLASPGCCSGTEWKEGETNVTLIWGNANDIADLNAMASCTLKEGSHPPVYTLLHFCTRVLRRLFSLHSEIAQQCLLELIKAFYELENCYSVSFEKKRNFGSQFSVFSQVFHPAYPTNSPRKLHRCLLSLGICSISSTLLLLFQLCVTSQSVIKANEIFEKHNFFSSFSIKNSKRACDNVKSIAPCNCLAIPTIQDILALKNSVIRYLCCIDLCSNEAQPLCWSLVRLLECLTRDPVFLLVLLGVKVSSLFSTGSLQDNTKDLSSQLFLDNINAKSPSLSSSRSFIENFKKPALNCVDDSSFSLQHSSYLNTTTHPIQSRAHSDVLEHIHTDMCDGEFPINIQNCPVTLTEEEVSSQQSDNEDLDDSVDDEDNSSDSDEDIIMEDQEEVIPLSLPHEANEQEESEAHFGLTLPRRGTSDSDSEDPDFDEEEDVPRIRGDDEDAEIMLLMPDRLSRTQMMTIHGEEPDTSMQLLAADDDDSGTPGLMQSGECMDHEQSDEEMSHSNGTLLEENDHHEIASTDNHVLLVEHVDPVETTCPETSHHHEVLPSSTDNPRREPVSTTVQPISFEVLYSCPATERFSLSHNEELYTTTNQLNCHFQDDSGVNEPVEGENEGENDMQPDDNYDEEEMGSALGIALPNLATASFSEISRLDSVPGNDTIQLNVGANRVVPSRVGNSTIANLFLSLPTTCPNGTHRGVSGTVSSVPTESGHQTTQTTIGWTSPGDIVLPRENPTLLFQRVSRHSTTTNTSGFDVLLIPSGLSSRLYAIQLPYSFQSSIRQGHYINHSTNNMEHLESSGTTTQKPVDNPEIFYVPTLFSLGLIMFDPWAQVAVTSLCTPLTDTSNAYTTCAQASCIRSRLSVSRDMHEFAGVSIICDEFKSWVLTERNLNYQTVYSNSDHQNQPASLSVTAVQNNNNSNSEGILFEHSEDVSQENSQNDLHEHSENITTVVMDSETGAEEQREVDNHSLQPEDESFASPNSITLEQAYGLLRHEEMTSAINFSSRLVRHLALVLGLTQQQLLSCLGIDVTFFSEIPEDIQNEIITQQLPFISVLSYESFRQANCNRLPEISSFIFNSMRDSVTPDATGINLVYGVNSNDNDIRTVAVSSNVETGDAETQATHGNHNNPEEALTNESTDRQWRLFFQHSTEYPWQVDQLSIHLDDSIIQQLPRALRESITEHSDSSQAPSSNIETLNVRGGNTAFDNASFLETLDAALREDLLLTATEEDLNALPAEYVAEAVLLRTHRATTQSPSRSVRFVNNHEGISLSQNNSQNRQENILSEEFRLISTAPSSNHTDGGTHQNGLQQLYNALFSAMNVRLHGQPSQTATRSNTRTSNATNTLIPINSNISAQNFNRGLGMSLRRTAVSLPGFYSNSSIASQRLIYEALNQILGDVDPSFLSIGPTRNRYESRDTRSHRNGILESFSRSDNFSNMIQNSCQHGNQEKCNTRLNGRNTRDLLCCNRCSSPFDIPLNPMGIVVICRLLFLKRQVYRRDMHRLFLSMTASHPSTRQGLLQVLLVIIWNAVTDIQAALNLPRASNSFLALGFPPERLYSSTTLTTSLLFDSHPEAAASIAGYRALEHIRSLLEVIPNLSEFFATSMLHPAYVTFWNSTLDAFPTIGFHDNMKPHDNLLDETDKKHGENSCYFSILNKNLSSRDYYDNVTEDSHNNEIKFSSCKQRIDGINMYEYPINVFLTLTSSRLFHTSSNHMVHLLSAIDFLLCASQKNENEFQQSSTSNVQEETSEENVNNFTNENEINQNITKNKIVCQNLSIKPTEGNHTHDLSLQQKILNVVSREAALTLCRLFTGIPPNTKACKDHSTFFNLYYASTSHQSPLPILSRIVGLFYWSPTHHHDIHELFVSSLKSLLHYIICHLQKLKKHTSTLVKLEALSKRNKNIDPTFDFLLPENIRTPLDTSLNLLLRLTVSLQDVFWSNPLALNFQTSQEKSKDENTGSDLTSETKRVNTNESGEEVQMKSPKIFQNNSFNRLEEKDEKEKEEEEEEYIREDKKSLVMLRDLFNHVGMCELWSITDDLLTEIELACPFLLNKFTETFHYKNKLVSSSSSSGTPVNDVFVNESRLILPLIVNQLLPLINSYLIVAQVTIAADLNFRASEVPRVVTQFSGTKCETQLQQKFSEKFSNYLCNSDKTYTKHHCEMLMFCERHRKLINLLVQHSPGILNGSFQPLVALAALCLTFENKRQYFRHSLKQLRDTTRYDPIRLNVRRNMVFMDSFHQLRLRNGEEMKGKLIVHFQGEEGVDAGGLVREWYGILSKEMFNPDYALFRREGTKSEFNHPNPLSHVNPDHLCFFKFVGRVIGKAIYDGHHLASYFTRSFYKQMLGRKSSPSDAECIDPELYKSLQMLLNHNIADLGLDLHFSTDIDEFGQNKIIDLLPNGRTIPVTEENKQEYVKLLCEHKISHGIRTQTESFLEGFHELIPPKFLTIFDDKELELLISGISFVDIEDLRANTVYHGYQATSPQIYWFWNLLEEMDQNTLATFLQFVTGTSRVPLGGFRELMGVCGPQLFSIHRDYDETRLPSAHTCFNQLDLPQYSSMQILKEKILKAIFEGSEGFGFA